MAVVAVAGAGALFANRDGGSAQRAESLDAVELARVGDRVLGREDAALTVVEFADFQCAACAVYAREELAVVKSELVEEGLVRFVFVDFPLPMHRHAMLAARAGRCADDQGRFWEFHDRLFAGQAEWVSDEDPTADFLGYADSVQIDRATFQNCLRSDRHDESIRSGQALGRSVGVRATPSIVANGRLLDGVPRARDLRALAMAQLEARTPPTAPE